MTSLFRALGRTGPAVLSLALMAALPQAAAAQDGNFSLELNNATDADGACRLTYVATNATGTDLEAVSYEVVIHDGDGIIPADGFLLFEFGAMKTGKTKVVQFVLPGRSCSAISKILVNDAAECQSAEGPQSTCLEGLTLQSRNGIEFVL